MTTVQPSPILQLIRRMVDDVCVRELPDRDLLERWHTQRDQAAFHGLLRRHGPMVLDVCRSALGNEADAEDAFQATFLILARKANSIRRTASLASWLHGVACRSALKARAQSNTRQKHEARVPPRPASQPDDLTWREVRQVIHEELSGLAERYRAPLVLCYLEGATQDAAAVQLDLAKSSLRERLERGREVDGSRCCQEDRKSALVRGDCARWFVRRRGRTSFRRWPGKAARRSETRYVDHAKAGSGQNRNCESRGHQRRG